MIFHHFKHSPVPYGLKPDWYKLETSDIVIEIVGIHVLGPNVLWYARLGTKKHGVSGVSNIWEEFGHPDIKYHFNVTSINLANLSRFMLTLSMPYENWAEWLGEMI